LVTELAPSQELSILAATSVPNRFYSLCLKQFLQFLDEWTKLFLTIHRLQKKDQILYYISMAPTVL